jgi:hypothetical protein
MELLLILLVAGSSLPAWMSLTAIRKLSADFGLSIACWLVAVLLQLIFIVRVGSGTLTLDYSLRFAAGGIPCDIASLILAARTNRNDNRPQGLVISASIGLFIWLALVSLH